MKDFIGTDSGEICIPCICCLCDKLHQNLEPQNNGTLSQGFLRSGVHSPQLHSWGPWLARVSHVSVRLSAGVADSSEGWPGALSFSRASCDSVLFLNGCDQRPPSVPCQVDLSILHLTTLQLACPEKVSERGLPTHSNLSGDTPSPVLFVKSRDYTA